jgi:hypothetical protein
MNGANLSSALAKGKDEPEVFIPIGKCTLWAFRFPVKWLNGLEVGDGYILITAKRNLKIVYYNAEESDLPLIPFNHEDLSTIYLPTNGYATFMIEIPMKYLRSFEADGGRIFISVTGRINAVYDSDPLVVTTECDENKVAG